MFRTGLRTPDAEPKGAADCPCGQTEQAQLRFETKKRQDAPHIACVHFTKRPEKSQPMRTPCGGSSEIQFYGENKTLKIDKVRIIYKIIDNSDFMQKMICGIRIFLFL